jgi:exopolyphosphatase/guanosine-5'-triphosphate,3'-diphosphate pyrophosphatase
MTQGPVAAIDCGSNSTRLLVVDENRSQLIRLMRITRLGEGVDRRHELSPQAIARTVETLNEFKTAMDSHGVVRVRMVATSAVRDAANGEEFIHGAGAAIGVAPEVLSGTEEGQLAYRGANADLEPFSGDTLVVDIGGGSTELTLGRGDAVSSVSLQLGCVRLTERFFGGDPPSGGEISAVRVAIETALREGEQVVPELAHLQTDRRLIGLAGTVSTLASLKLGLTEYRMDKLHHARISTDEVQDMGRNLGAMSAHERGKLVGMVRGREDVILGGALVLEMVLLRYGFREVIVSESDILDGIAMSLYGDATSANEPRLP